MTERVAERVKRLMREHPGVVVHFTDAVRADSPAVKFVCGEADGANRVALRQGILPLPAAIACLTKEQRTNEHGREDRETNLPD